MNAKPKRLTAQQLFDNLVELDFDTKIGGITFTLADVSVKISTTDTVGITLQAWLKQYLAENNYFFSEPNSTQEFPDFYLDDNDSYKHMLEVKAFHSSAVPAFDIANFESYCDSVKDKPYRLDADYLIFGYEMFQNGDIKITDLWLKKIWQIAGTSKRFPLKTQVKRDMIYNIRPNTDFKRGRSGPFNSKEEFLMAIYETLEIYFDKQHADKWKTTLAHNYKEYYGSELPF